MTATVLQRVSEWGRAEDGVNFILLWDEINRLVEMSFNEYEPTAGPVPLFWERCKAWLESAALETDQKALLELVPMLLFVGNREFRSLYQTALRDHLVPWLSLVDPSIDVTSPAYSEQVEASLRATWICSGTDSMQIAAFFHVNNLQSGDYRPDWRSLAKFGDADKIRVYMAGVGLHRIVLLEDFVGSGTQMAAAIEFAARIDSSIQILALPLIVCPVGHDRFAKLTLKYPNVAYASPQQLPPTHFVTPTAAPGEPPLFSRMRELVARIEDTVRGDPALPNWPGPFGFKKTGALVVTHSNCPNNTLPVIHWQSPTWSPLFPRSSRV